MGGRGVGSAVYSAIDKVAGYHTQPMRAYQLALSTTAPQTSLSFEEEVLAGVNGQPTQQFLIPERDLFGPKADVGLVTELIDVGMSAGKRTNHAYVDPNAKHPQLKPDIIRYQFPGRCNQVREDKGAALTARGAERLRVSLPQLNMYRGFQVQLPKWEFLYDVFRYKAPQAMDGMPQADLIGHLSGSILYHLKLPIAVIDHIVRGAEDGTLRDIARIERKKSGQEDIEVSMRVRAAALEHILVDPHEFIRTIGLNPDRFEIRRMLSPAGMSVDGVPVTQFPVLQLHDTAPGKLLDRLCAERPQTRIFRSLPDYSKGPLFAATQSPPEVPTVAQPPDVDALEREAIQCEDSGQYVASADDDVPF